MKNKLLYCIAAFVFCLAVNAQQAPVQLTEIPGQAQNFLKEHFKSPFHHSIKEVARNRVTYTVFLNDDTEIKFNDAGRWEKVNGKGEPVPHTFIQKQILDYVRINYPKETIEEVERITTGYKTRLSNGIIIEFDTVGIFVKAR